MRRVVPQGRPGGAAGRIRFQAGRACRSALPRGAAPLLGGGEGEGGERGPRSRRVSGTQGVAGRGAWNKRRAGRAELRVSSLSVFICEVLLSRCWLGGRGGLEKEKGHGGPSLLLPAPGAAARPAAGGRAGGRLRAWRRQPSARHRWPREGRSLSASFSRSPFPFAAGSSHPWRMSPPRGRSQPLCFP